MENEPKRCQVCGEEVHPQAALCGRCRGLRNRGNGRDSPNKEARVAALKKSWNGGCFRCHYSGVRLVVDDHRSPRYLTFDHRTPGDESDIVVAASCINDMKSDLSEEEFRAIVIGLASAFQGEPFDQSLLDLRHWRR